VALQASTRARSGEVVSLYYSDDYVTLYHGKAEDYADYWCDADVLVTDPPYGIGWVKHGGGTGYTQSVKHLGIQNDHDTSVRDSILELWGDRPAIIFGSFRAPFPANVKQTLVWQKPVDAGVLGSTTGYRTDVELIFLTGKHPQRPPSKSSVLATRGGVSRYRTEHPHSKPVSLLEELIEWTNGVIADPFGGSGATLLAAKNLGRKSIGVELEERYCELIASRLSQEVLDFGALT
jgi:hypothetical protein